ncbi:MAG: AAA family ATPase [Planctomycetaceae bacterium]|nr:AAA family ATPase [Planctomycetaceae bacterium]
MRIETIRIRNFKALQDVQLEKLPPFCVFVGRNGSGKTTLFRVFGFLKNCLEHNVRTALNVEGGRNGFKEVVTRGHDHESIEMEIQFRMEIAGHNRLVTYLLEVAQDPKGSPIVSR